jgi:glycosyltransferase involved in cell wall biosynthesis
MKIWIDLRFLSNNVYSKFVKQLIEIFILEKDNNFVIFTNAPLTNFNKENVKIKQVNIENWSFKEQTKFKKILNNEKLGMVLFFNHFRPIFYKWYCVTFVWSLKEVYYTDFSSYFQKYKYLFLMWRNLKKSDKIISFDENTRDELVEKFDIPETKIELLDGFFPDALPIIPILSGEEEDKDEKLNINIKAKYSINHDKFFIYSWWDWIEKNYERLIKVFAKLRDKKQDIALVFLWHNISTNINLRKLILESEMQKNTYFLWEIPLTDKKYLYSESLWTIFTSFYEPFPFKLWEPLMFWSKIISSDLKSVKSIFWDKINYFSPISTNNIFDTISEFLKNNGKSEKVNYKDILKKYNKDETAKKFKELVEA